MLRRLIKYALPYGIVRFAQRRAAEGEVRTLLERRSMGLGMPVSQLMRAADECHYWSWPEHLQTAPHDWVLVDVGANAGQFSIAATTVAKPASLILFEPIEELASQLDATFQKLPVRVIAKAVGNDTGSLALNIMTENVFSSILAPQADLPTMFGKPDLAVSSRRAVPVVRLDDEIADVPQIGILKIDVQGYGLQVLQGACQCLRRTDCVIMEVDYRRQYCGEASFDEINHFLADHGLSLAALSPPHLSAERRPLWADAIYHRLPPEQPSASPREASLP